MSATPLCTTDCINPFASADGRGFSGWFPSPTAVVILLPSLRLRYADFAHIESRVSYAGPRTSPWLQLGLPAN